MRICLLPNTARGTVGKQFHQRMNVENTNMKIWAGDEFQALGLLTLKSPPESAPGLGHFLRLILVIQFKFWECFVSNKMFQIPELFQDSFIAGVMFCNFSMHSKIFNDYQNKKKPKRKRFPKTVEMHRKA